MQIVTEFMEVNGEEKQFWLGQSLPKIQQNLAEVYL